MAGYDLALLNHARESWGYARNGILPNAGGWLDQPHRELLMINAVNGEFVKWEATIRSK